MTYCTLPRPQRKTWKVDEEPSAITSRRLCEGKQHQVHNSETLDLYLQTYTILKDNGASKPSPSSDNGVYKSKKYGTSIILNDLEYRKLVCCRNLVYEKLGMKCKNVTCHFLSSLIYQTIRCCRRKDGKIIYWSCALQSKLSRAPEISQCRVFTFHMDNSCPG